MKSDLDAAVTQACLDFVAGLDKLNTDPYIREAVVKLAVREVAWALLEAFEDQHTLADQLALMAELVREHREEQP